MQTFNTNQFSFKNSEFFAEISELGSIDVLRHPSERLVLVSEITGKRAEFFLDHTQRDADHDIQFWTLKPTEVTCARYPELSRAFITILND